VFQFRNWSLSPDQTDIQSTSYFLKASDYSVVSNAHDPLDLVYTHYMHRFKESTFTNNCDFVYNKHTMLTVDRK